MPSEHSGTVINKCSAGVCAGGSSSGYKTLATYHSSYCGRGVMAPVPASAPCQSRVIVPSWGGMDYDTLSHGAGPSGGCSGGKGYFGMAQAYPRAGGCSSCTSYTSKVCGSC